MGEIIRPQFLEPQSSIWALDFDGNNDYVDTGNVFQSMFRGSFSFSIWIKPDDGQPAAWVVFVSNRNSAGEDIVGFQIQEDGTLYFVYESNNNRIVAQTAEAAFSNGQETWHHVVGVADSTIGGIGGLKVYLDGSVQTLDGTNNGDTSGITFADWTSSDELFIGARDNGGTADRFFAGLIDDVCIYNHPPSAAEVAWLYKNPQQPDMRGLVGWWRFQEGFGVANGTQIRDWSGQGNHGSMQGFSGNPWKNIGLR